MIVKIQSQDGSNVSTYHVRAARIIRSMTDPMDINVPVPKDHIALEFPDGKDYVRPLTLGDAVYLMNDVGKTFDTWRMPQPQPSVRDLRLVLRRILRNLVDNPLRGVFQTTTACDQIEDLYSR